MKEITELVDQFARLTYKIAISLAAAGALLAASYEGEGRAWWSHVQYLAGDSLEGRNVGTPGFDKAAEYVAKQFEQIGLKPAGNKGYFQPLEFRTRRIDEAKSSLAIVVNGNVKPLKLGDDAAFSMRIEPAKNVEADVVFAGHGLRIPELGIDDLKGLDVKGKVVMVLSGAPRNVPGALAAHYRSNSEFWKGLQAAGAIGTITFTDPTKTDYPWERAAAARGAVAMSLQDPATWETRDQKVSIILNPARVDQWLQGTGHTAQELMALAREQKPLPKFSLKVKVVSKPEYVTGQAESKNVAGLLVGSDPKLKNEYIVMTAHLDHLGLGAAVNGDRIYNGAMDNASGVATLIETAKALAAGPKLKRSVVFVAVTGEEKGLLGSKFYAAHPTVEKKQIVANLNTDMFLPIIPLHRLTVYGLDESDLGATLKRVADTFDVQVQPDPEPEMNHFIRSDQYNFIKNGVPALAMKFGAQPGTAEEQTLKNWSKQRYHAPSDDVQQPIDLEGAARFDRIVIAFLRDVADSQARPQWYPNSFFKRYTQ